MASKAKKTSTRSRGMAPRIQNILYIGRTFREGTLIHFTAQQWKQMTSRIHPGKGVPKYGVALEYYPIPDGGVITQPICNPNVCETCNIRVTGFGAGGTMTVECRCRRDPRCPDLPSSSPGTMSNLCRLVIRRTGMTLNPILCISQGCNGQCRLRAVRQGNRYLLGCWCS